MPEGFADHFSRVADQYAAWRPGYPPALFRWLADQVPGTDLAWDCAAGSGQATRHLAVEFDRVLATDASAQQLAAMPPLPNVSTRVTPAESSGLPTGSADLITVAQALHWLELSSFYAEARRVLRPGGLLAVWTYQICLLEEPGIDAALEHYYHHTVGPWWPPERRLLEEGYASMPFPFPELPSPRFDMRADWTLEHLIGYVGTWSATGRYREATGLDPVPRLAREVGALWGGPDRVRMVRWPLTIRVGRNGAQQ